MPEPLTILVLGGGPDRERVVSLRSAAAVAQALRQAGHTVVEADVSRDDASALDTPCDVVFPVLHGRFGEGGPLQHMLEHKGLRYVGAAPRAAALAMDKCASKRIADRRSVPTPPYQLLGSETLLKLDPPLVIKPLTEGSSFGVAICHDLDQVAAARRRQHAHFAFLLAERYVPGSELTVGIIDRQLLPPIRIVPQQEFYDFESKYDRNDTRYEFDTGLPADTIEQIERDAWSMFEGVGCRDLARVDFLIDEGGRPWFLEINAMPGFTDHSLLPMAARRAGMEMPALCDRLARLAFER